MFYLEKQSYYLSVNADSRVLFHDSPILTIQHHID